MSGRELIRNIAEPESTQTCTSRYTDFQVLPANNISVFKLINLSLEVK